MQKINFDFNWSFTKEAPSIYYPVQGRMQGSKEVNLPHDCNIDEAVSTDCPDGMQVGYFKGNMGVYTKFFNVPMEWENKHIYLEMDGAYCNTEIVLNGHQIAIHPNGYMPFVCELTDYLILGEKNRLAIFVNNSMMRTARWYSGTGIYRHVNILIGDVIHLTEYPLFIATKEITSDRAMIDIEVEVKNNHSVAQKVNAVVRLYEDRGHHCMHSDEVIAQTSCVLYLPAGKVTVSQCTMIVVNPKIWDLENPNLYIAECEIIKDGTVLDTADSLCGIRTISVDRQKGFQLNGETIKLKGGCMHHDNGLLGAASFYDSEYRRLKIHKENGYNGIRGAHNPMSKDMLEACDRLGLIMMAEAFDVWNMHKNVNDYHLFFPSWWERDLEAFIKRDRNHPSICFWSIGNEITERNGLKDGAETAEKLARFVRNLDQSRLITAAVPTLFNGLNDTDTERQLQSMMKAGGPGQNLSTEYSQSIWADRTEGFCSHLDIVGYNYLDSRYRMDHERYPERIICGTESYPGEIDRVWELVEELPYVIGDFTWTSQDYLGETTCGNIVYRDSTMPAVGRGELQGGNHYPARTAHCSDFDICGYDMPALHYRKVVWGSLETYIAVMHPENYGLVAYRTTWAWDECANHWDYPSYDGKPIAVEVYSASDTVELFINGESIGTQPTGKANRYKTRFETIYRSGSIEAISYTDGQEVSRQRLESPGAATGIQVIAESKKLVADGYSLVYVNIELVDRKGNRVTSEQDYLTLQVEGAATLQAFGTGIPKTEELYTTGQFTTYEGRAQAILRSNGECGCVKIKVVGKKYGTVSAELIAY